MPFKYVFDIESSNDYPNQEAPTLNVPFLLILTVMLASSILAIYVDGNVKATLVATLRPEGEGQSTISGRFRGLSMFLLHRLVKVFLLSRFSTEGFSPMKCFLLNVTIELLLLNLKVANVYTILAQQSEISFYQRILSWSTWLNNFPAALLYSIVSSICFYLPAYVIHVLSFWGGEYLNISEGMQFATFLALIVILYFGTVVPAYAIFIRVAASTLPLQDDSREKENIYLSVKSAWQTFPWPARICFFQTLAKVFALETGVCVVLWMFALALFHPVLHNDVALFFVKYAG